MESGHILHLNAIDLEEGDSVYCGEPAVLVSVHSDHDETHTTL
jgi:hypothetical protein